MECIAAQMAEAFTESDLYWVALRTICDEMKLKTIKQ